MTTPWPPPAPARASDARAPQERWAPALGWALLLLVGIAAVVVSAAEVPWASGQLLSASATELDAGDLVNRADGALPFAVLASIVGLVAAAFFGSAVLPTGRIGRLVLTGVVVAIAALLVAVGLVDVDAYTPLGETLVILLLVVVVPTAVLLRLTWHRSRRAAAVTALVLAGLAALGAVVVLLQLIAGTATAREGAWATLLLDLVGVLAAVVVVRSVPPRSRGLQPGDPGWTA